MSDDPLPPLDAAGFEAMACDTVPLAGLLGLRLERFDGEAAVVRLPWREIALRPGGSVSGPAMMTLVDIALWGAILARIGNEPLCVTTDLTFHFLAKPRHADVLAEARVIRLGRTLAIAEARLFSEGNVEPVAHAVGTYAIPPRSRS
ncbi:PaaI family thioesterase [Geminicoccus roseus]|uniref:PaaI family thioesterase n=1 Tax=Geminicoccus roseus TaxID=404900 RepID=UPI00146FA47E|nr:PaaI family thioesterase [Geminicoccus roseus]